ncbi:MAG: hypothetical protein JSV80_00870, partial [Acidobacteriota bacterium]
MSQRILAMAGIFVLLSAAWFVLAGSVSHRTWSADQRLLGEVAGLWGAEQTQLSPELEFMWRVKKTENDRVKDISTGEEKTITREKWVWERQPVILDSSELTVELALDHRKKGLLWYATYGVVFDGQFGYTHQEEREGLLSITYRFPTTQASYDDFQFEIDGQPDSKISTISSGQQRIVQRKVPVSKGTAVPFRITYRTRGLDAWHYSFGNDVNHV